MKMKYTENGLQTTASLEVEDLFWEGMTASCKFGNCDQKEVGRVVFTLSMSASPEPDAPLPTISNPCTCLPCLFSSIALIIVADDEHTIKIMLATDNHIGFNERDPVRGQDSINSFREILQLAVKHEVNPLCRVMLYRASALQFSRSTSSCSPATCFTKISLLENACIKLWPFSESTLWATNQFRLSFSVIQTRVKQTVSRPSPPSCYCPL